MNASVWIALGVTVIVAGVLILMVFETVRLSRRQPPITPVIRHLVVAFPGWAVGIGGILVFALGALMAHFGWDAACSR